MSTLPRAFFIATAITATGCALNPVTGERELSLVSPEQEIAMGERQYAPSQQSQGGQYYIDPRLQAYVADVGVKLASVSHQPDLPYEFVVLNNSIPNAWTLPGGKIAVNRGLLTELEDEAELAAVLGHEVVHAAARHSASQMSRGTLVGLTAQLATIAAANWGYGDLGNMASQLGGAAFMATYGRDDELEADDYGMQYMAEAGYDPQAAVSLQETFVRLSGDRQSDFISGLFASHPPSQARVNANYEHAHQLPGGERYRERYQRHIAQLKRDAPAYMAQDSALAALKEEDAHAALGYLDQAIKAQPAEAQFWEMRGHAWSMLDNLDNAEKAYTTATRKNPELFSPLLYRGITRYRLGKLQTARGDLEASNALLPTAVSAYYLGDIHFQQGNEDQAAQYFQQALSSGNKEVAARAYNKLAWIELEQQPDKYIASRPFVGQDGQMRIGLLNRTDHQVAGVQVQLLEWVNPQTVRNVPIPRKRYKLSPGQQIEITTGLGPFEDAREAHRFRSRVIAAKPVGGSKAIRKTQL
jgi:predicted Zn-dependent protease